MTEQVFVQSGQNKIHISVPPFDSISTGFELDLKAFIVCRPLHL